MSRLSLFLGFLIALLPFLVTQPVKAQAQQAGTTPPIYVKFAQGTSDFSGNAGAGRGFGDLFDANKFSDSEDFQYAVTMELGYRFSPSLSLGLGYQLGTYYFNDLGRLGGESETLNTVQLLGRYKLGARNWPVAPYIDLGVNLSEGVKHVGFGPSMGGGLDIAIDNRFSLFIESRLNLTFPDEALDTFAAGQVPFDIVTIMPAIGTEIDLTGPRTSASQ